MAQKLFCIFSIAILMSTLMVKCLAESSTTAKPPTRKYPIRAMLGNMYHRFRNNRTGYLLIPPLLRLAYQYGPNIIERMGNALGLGASGSAAADGIDGLVQSALSGALGGGGAAGGQLASAAGQVPAALGALGGGIPGAAPLGFGGAAAPLGFAPRPVFFRR